MKKMVCDICSATDFQKDGEQFVCLTCGCRYSLADAQSLLREVGGATTPPMPTPTPVAPPMPTPQRVAPPMPTPPPAPTPSFAADDSELRAIARRERAELHTVLSFNRIQLKLQDLGHWRSTYNAYGAPTQVFCEGPDPRGYLGCLLSVTVVRGKAIRSVWIDLTPYNAHGRIVKCNATGQTTRTLSVSGPIYQGSPMTVGLPNAWLNPVVSDVAVERALVEYVDGTRELYVAGEYYFERAVTKKELELQKYTLYITRKSQYSCMDHEMTATVNDQTQTIENGKTVEFTLPGGEHTLTVMLGGEEMTLTVEMDKSQHLEYSFNGRELSVEAVSV